MTRTKKIVAACALTLGVFGATAAPAFAISGGWSSAPSHSVAGADSRHSSGVGTNDVASAGDSHLTGLVDTDNRHSS